MGWMREVGWNGWNERDERGWLGWEGMGSGIRGIHQGTMHRAVTCPGHGWAVGGGRGGGGAAFCQRLRLGLNPAGLGTIPRMGR